MAAAHTRPNILIIMSDQHSKHVLGAYGNELVRTPNLDRLAAQGMRFDNAYCAGPLCVPSRMSFMTARTPTRNRVWQNSHILSSAIPTWAHVLGAAGYRTSLIGRMHFVGPDQRHGFEERPIGEYWAGHPGVPVKGGPMWTRFSSASCGQSRPAAEIAGTGTTHYQWFDQQVAGATLDFLDRAAADADATGDTRPFAAVAGFVLPHCPFIAPKALFDYYYDKVDVPEVEEVQPASVRRCRDLRKILTPELSPERVRIARAAYFALCEFFDMQVGRILDRLEATGLAENTLVVYASDHGEMAGEHGCWWKSSYYEASVGVPLIARLPGLIPAGSTSSAICNLMDLGPTMAEAAGTGMCDVDGRSLWPVLQGISQADQPNETVSELVDCDAGDHPNLPSRMIRVGRWKLWKFSDPDDLPPVLFDLEADPGELNDLGRDPAHAGIRDELMARLYADWDPEHAGRVSEELNQDLRTISAWGREILPECKDTLAAPGPEIEDDVQLL